MSTTYTLDRRQVRSAQRIAHLLAGVGLLAYVYLAPYLGDAVLGVVQWVVVPVAVASGVALWKWPKIRQALRPRAASS